MHPSVELCFLELDRILPLHILMEMASHSENEMPVYYKSVGGILTKKFASEPNSPLEEYFVSIGITHSCEIPTILLRAYWRYLHGVELDIPGLSLPFINYWQHMKDIGLLPKKSEEF